jgi:hypothetical protein
MKVGDMVRFAIWGEFDHNEKWDKAEKKHVGMLVEHDKLMKTADILYRGEVVKVRSQFVEKSGKKDLSETSI